MNEKLTYIQWLDRLGDCTIVPNEKLARLAEERKEDADEIERLREALREAVDEIEAWASYASPYFREKHDLEGTLADLRAKLGDDEPPLLEDRWDNE